MQRGFPTSVQECYGGLPWTSYLDALYTVFGPVAEKLGSELKKFVRKNNKQWFFMSTQKNSDCWTLLEIIDIMAKPYVVREKMNSLLLHNIRFCDDIIFQILC